MKKIFNIIILIFFFVLRSLIFILSTSGYETHKFNEIISSKITKKNKGEIGEETIIRALYNIKNDKEKISRIFGINSEIMLLDPSNNNEILDPNLIKKSS